jgi:protein involved in polysaccharide export with SLBB domain
MKKILAIALLSLAISACESSPADNSNSNTRANTPAAATPAPTTATPEASPAAKAEIKAGDKVKVTISGAATEATVVSVDEKAGKATVKVQGQKENKTVALTEIVKQ